MSESTSEIFCQSCKKPFCNNTILKHLSHKRNCKEKYSSTDLKTLLENSKKISKAKEKVWKKTFNTGRFQLKSLISIIENKENSFHNSRKERIDEIKSNGLTNEAKRKLELIEEMVTTKSKELLSQVNVAIKNFENHKHSQLFDIIINEWKKLDSKADEILTNLDPKPENSMNPEQANLYISFEEIKCKSCNETFKNIAILKHLGKKKSCKMKYADFEIENLRVKARVREKARLKNRYQNEKDFREKVFKEERQEIEYKQSKRYFKGYREELFKSLKARGARKVIEAWKDTNCGRGERCRSEIRNFKSKDIEYVTKQMTSLDNKIEQKLKELKSEILEVEEEVERVVGHWDFQDFLHRNELFCVEWRRDWDFVRNMFANLKCYVKQEMEDLYVLVVNELKDLGIKLREEIKP